MTQANRFNVLIGQKMDSRKETVEDLARALKCSVAFARHIRSSTSVPVSQHLLEGLSKHYAIPLKRLERLVAPRNRQAREYYRKYRSKAARAAKAA